MIGQTDLATTLSALAPALARARHPWWILGSAAVMLHGADPGEVRDADVLLDKRDCRAVLGALGLVPAPGESDGRFRSAVFARWNGAALPVDLFAGFCLFEAGDWHPFQPQTRIAVQLGSAGAFIPERDELIGLLGRFGRAKDLSRIAALSRSGPFPSRSESA